MKKLYVLLLVVFGLTANVHAGLADLWKEVSGKIGADSTIIVAMDLKDFKNTQIFKTGYNKLLAKEADAKMAVDTAKQLCRLDLVNEFENVIVAVNDAEGAIVFIKFKSITEKSMNSCIETLNAKKSAGVIIKKDGTITEYAQKNNPDAKDNPLVSWISANTIMVSGGTNARERLEKAIAGSGDFMKNADTAKIFDKINLNSIIWGFSSKTMPVAENISVTHAYGSIDIRGGALKAEVKMLTADKEGATELVKMAKMQIKQATSDKQTPPQFKRALGNVKIENQGNLINVLLNESEKTLISLLALAGL